MQGKILKIFFTFSLVLYLSSCTVNFFSVFSPREASNIQDTETLLNLGNSALLRGDYSNALVAYENVLNINPTNSLALLGAANSYILNDQDLKLKNLAESMLPNDLKLKLKLKTIKLMAEALETNGPGGLIQLFAQKKNSVYRVAKYVSKKLSVIVDGKSDNIISSNDINVNLNYFIFNLIDTLFLFLDNNQDGVNDEKDWIYIDENFTPKPMIVDRISNRVIKIMTNISVATNINFNSRDLLIGFILNPEDNPLRNTLLLIKTNLVELEDFMNTDIIGVIETIPQILTNVEKGLYKSLASLDRIYNKLASQQIKDLMKELSKNISNGISVAMSNVSESYDQIGTNFYKFRDNINELIDTFDSPAKFKNNVANMFGSNYIVQIFEDPELSNSIYIRDTNYSLMDLISKTNLSFTNTFGVGLDEVDTKITNLFAKAGLTNMSEISSISSNYGKNDINEVADIASYITNRFPDTVSKYSAISNSLSKLIK